MIESDFSYLADLIKQRSGIVITKDKSYLLESRLAAVARTYQLDDISGIVQKLRKADRALEIDVVDAMTTNESLFFRDQHPFDQLRDFVLPKLMAERKSTKRIKILCAACSSGQEPYSIAMLLKELGPKVAGWTFDIQGTDISRSMIERCKRASYTQFEVQRGLPITLLVKYFEQQGQEWFLKPEIKNMVKFREFNLLEKLTPLGHYDIVFCRNVLIYFDQPTKRGILEGFAGLMPSDGVLYLGGAETIIGITDKFGAEPGRRGIYRKAA
jgi:chemotaxis protein methyltransferase CheR